MKDFNLYNGKPRNLIIWDESLIISDHRAIEKVRLEQGLGWLRPSAKLTRKAAFRDTMQYLEAPGRSSRPRPRTSNNTDVSPK